MLGVFFFPGPAARGEKPACKKVGAVDIADLDAKQLRLFQFHLTKLVSAILVKESYVTQVIASSKSNLFPIWWMGGGVYDYDYTVRGRSDLKQQWWELDLPFMTGQPLMLHLATWKVNEG